MAIAGAALSHVVAREPGPDTVFGLLATTAALYVAVVCGGSVRPALRSAPPTAERA
ncbi:hypothetical protein [Streptomyces sp. NPDC097619]|uniref:hypothetical protein n=1 Tax=Streptomyces sp. NPDC097619 TaxID=3157228 RepID=UPI00331DD1A9